MSLLPRRFAACTAESEKDLLLRASRERFEAVLRKVPHVEPDERDRLD
jgi:hypothetical protein